MIPRNAVEGARFFLRPVLEQAGCVLDATAGNGHDVLFLCKNTPPGCRIWAFDIQPAAIRCCSELLERNGFRNNVRLILANHAFLSKYITEPVDAAIFNLGYLPGQNHSVTTTPESLKMALDSLLKLLAPGGCMAIVAYPGHEPGQRELDFLETYLPERPQDEFAISRYSFINQKNNPAILYFIGKTGGQQYEDTSPDSRKGNSGKIGGQNAG